MAGVRHLSPQLPRPERNICYLATLVEENVSLPQTTASESGPNPKQNSRAIMTSERAFRKETCQPGSLPDSAGHRRTCRDHMSRGLSHSPQDVCLFE